MQLQTEQERYHRNRRAGGDEGPRPNRGGEPPVGVYVVDYRYVVRIVTSPHDHRPRRLLLELGCDFVRYSCYHIVPSVGTALSFIFTIKAIKN